MADPLSITASVLAITPAFLQASKGLYDFVSTTKDAPKEVATIAREVYTFHALADSTARSLQQPHVRTVVERDATLREAMISIETSPDNCTKSIEGLLVGLKNVSLASASQGKKMLTSGMFDFHT